MTATLVPVATRYAFRDPALMTGHPLDSAHLYDPAEITVDHRGGDTWAVSRGAGWLVWCERDRDWEWEPQPSSRDDEFLARCRYSLDLALEIAARLAEERPR